MLVLIAMSTVASPARASSSLAFVRTSTDGSVPANGDIYTIPARGGVATELTTDGQDQNPAWSPDGQHIAFQSQRDGHWQIYIMNADGTNQHQLFTTSSNDTAPTWSPDGGHLAFVSDRDGNPEIYSANADGTSQTRLTNNSVADDAPNWSPDGSTIAYTTIVSGDPELATMNPDGTNIQHPNPCAGVVATPSWSPDSRQLAFSEDNPHGGRDVARLVLSGNTCFTITNSTFFFANETFSHPTWASDASTIAFAESQAGIQTLKGDSPDAGGAPTASAVIPGTQAGDIEPAYDVHDVVGAVRCSKYASPAGSSAGPGTEGAPYQTPQQLIDALSSGQTGCLFGGRYVQSVKITKNGITLTSKPGQRATWQGRVILAGNGIVLQDLNLDGRNFDNPGTSTPCSYDPAPCPFPSPDVEGNSDVLIGNDITSDGNATAIDTHNICVIVNNALGNTPVGTIIASNTIHDCGYRSANQESSGGHLHGIYVVNATGTTIANNLIVNNADRGIQLWPNAQSTMIDHNTIDRNGSGIDYGSAGSTASSYNTATFNLVTNSQVRWNVYSDWEGSVGTDNVFAANCRNGGNPNPSYNVNGGTDPSMTGVIDLLNTNQDPQYVDAANGDYRVQNDSCKRYGANAQSNP